MQLNIDFDKIVELKRTRMEIDGLVDKERRLSSPLVGDCSYVKRAYSHFLEVTAGRKDSGSVLLRKKFLFIALYLFAPGVFLGDYLPKGLRKTLCEIFGFRSGAAVSNNCSDLLFLYQNYRDFRDDVHGLFDMVAERIAGDGGSADSTVR